MISNILGGRKMIPVVEKMEVFPVAGHDCMELNLSGAHAPYFTRNIVILTDSNGVEGVGEVPGGEKITNALEQVKDLVIGTSIADYKQTLNKVRKWLDENIKDDVRGLQTFDLRTGLNVITATAETLSEPGHGYRNGTLPHRLGHGSRIAYRSTCSNSDRSTSA